MTKLSKIKQLKKFFIGKTAHTKQGYYIVTDVIRMKGVYCLRYRWRKYKPYKGKEIFSGPATNTRLLIFGNNYFNVDVVMNNTNHVPKVTRTYTKNKTLKMLFIW